MLRKKTLVFFLFIFFFLLILSVIGYKKISIKDKKKIETNTSTQTPYSSNIIENVNYSTKDADGNEYNINALRGEIDYLEPNIIYLTEVRGVIKLKNSDHIFITSRFGKYNIDNFDTIFSKNVIINYLDNNIQAGYLDFSLKRNSMIVSKKVIYNNNNNILNADVVEIDINTKDTKIFMYEKDKKVNIKSKN